MTDVTSILNAIEQGNDKAVDELLPLVYEELRHLAARKISHERPGQTLQATALVHEAYIRLVGSEIRSWKGRTYFFSAAAEAMRRILIEKARHKQSQKHGGDKHRVNLDEAEIIVENPPTDLIALDEALNKLTKEEPEVADLVKMRYFAGLTLEQTAVALGVSRRTAERYWAYARAWLYQEINKSEQPPLK